MEQDKATGKLERLRIRSTSVIRDMECYLNMLGLSERMTGTSLTSVYDKKGGRELDSYSLTPLGWFRSKGCLHNQFEGMSHNMHISV